MAFVHSLNIGGKRRTTHSAAKATGIDKRPTDQPVEVSIPEPKGIGGSGLAGDVVCDKRHHGGPDQAIYAYAREDLDAWAAILGRNLPSGVFGENLTTIGIDLNAARIGERWQVGDGVVLEVSVPRVPCRTFAGWLRETGWIKRFTERAVPGTYLRVITPGTIRAGDPIVVIDRPAHDITVQLTFRAVTTEPELLPRLVPIAQLPAEIRQMAAKRAAFELGTDPERLTPAPR